MKISDVVSRDKNTPQLGDVIIVTYKDSNRVGIVGELNDEIARIYEFDTRNLLGTVILKYVHKLDAPSKHPRKVLARRLGLECDDDSPAARFMYKDIKRTKTNMDMDKVGKKD